jgi:hypothetical protein
MFFEEKLRIISNAGYTYKTGNYGATIDKALVIARNKSLWRPVGILDWLPYYGLNSLLTAYKEGTLEAYKEKQIKAGRQQLAVVKPNVWKDKKKEKEMKEFYAKRSTGEAYNDKH